MVGLRPRFEAYLEGRRHNRNAVRSYCYFLGVLLRKAEELTGTPPDPELPETWKPIAAKISKVRCLKQIIYDAAYNGKSPGEYTDTDLENWGSSKFDQGFNYDYVKVCKNRFRRLVFTMGLSSDIPNLSPPSGYRPYSIPVEKFPEPLRTEFKNLKQWKSQDYADGRGYRGRHREISSSTLEDWVCRMVGLLAQGGAAPSSLNDLFTKENVQRFVRLAKELRNMSGTTLRNGLGLAFGAVKHYPPLQDAHFPGKFDWMESVIAQIRPDPDSLKRRSKERKWVKYSVLETIPDMIEAEIMAKPKATPRWVAWMRQEQLILKWLTVLPWRQRNLREAKLASGGGHPANTFKAEVSELSPMDLPSWAEAALKANPEEKLWQYAFDEDETKSGREVRGIVPGPLVRLLEDFIANHRPRLIKGTDPGTLFLNQKGGSFTERSISGFVTNVALRYVKRRVNPHLFRDIFAVAYLKDTRDYLSLSKVLWHKNPKITIEQYARFFDESAGARVVEEWFERRQDAKKQMQPQVPNETLEDQLRNLQVRLCEKTAELNNLKRAISLIEAKNGTTRSTVSSAISSSTAKGEIPLVVAS
jgi:hypothetical protein